MKPPTTAPKSALLNAYKQVPWEPARRRKQARQRRPLRCFSVQKRTVAKPEEFRSPRGVRKSWMNEPAGWRAGLWGFGLGVAPSGGGTAGKPRRWRAWKSPDWQGLSAWRSEPRFGDRGCTVHPEVRHRVRHAPRRGSSGGWLRQVMPGHGEPARCDVERNGGPRG